MKTLSKVCQIVGTTRKTLRGYDEIGLLHPTAKTENGYWLYDDAAISKLMFIQLFADAGYERKTIKEILENPAADFLDEYDKVIASLEERKKRLTAQIHTLTRLKLIARLPMKFHAAVESADFAKIYQKTSFTENMESIIQELSNQTPQDIAEGDQFIPFVYQLTAISCFKDRDPASAEVQDLVKDTCSNLTQIILSNEKEETEGRNLEEWEISELIEESLREMLKEMPDYAKELQEKLGEDSLEFIKKAFHVNTENLKKELSGSSASGD